MHPGAIFTVGGSPEPIIKALTWQPAARVLFVVSEKSEPEVALNVLPRLSYIPQYEPLRVSTADDLGACYRDCCRGIRAWLEKWRLPPNALYFDNTGGTKPMSTALALAAVENSIFQYHYVSGQRDKSELGTVLSGTEYLVAGSMLAIKHREMATRFYEQGYVEQAAQLLDEAAAIACDYRSTLRAYAALCRVLSSLDRLDFRTDLAHELGKLQPALQVAFESAGNQEALNWLPRFRERLGALHQEVKAKAEHPNCLRELLACARRRAQQGHYDDAVARLYRALELHGQDRLYRAWGMPQGIVHLDKLDTQLAAKLRQRFPQAVDETGSRLKLGLRNLYEALSEFSPEESDRPLGSLYASLRSALEKRNDSWLAHGTRSSSLEDFEEMWRVVLETLRITEEEIPGWPRLSFTL